MWKRQEGILPEMLWGSTALLTPSFQDSGLRNSGRRNFWCFKSGLWCCIPAALGNQHTILMAKGQSNGVVKSRAQGVSFPKLKSQLYYSGGTSDCCWGSKPSEHLKRMQTRAWPQKHLPSVGYFYGQWSPLLQLSCPDSSLWLKATHPVGGVSVCIFLSLAI